MASTDAGNEFVEVDCWFLNKDTTIAIVHDGALARVMHDKRNVWQVTPFEWKRLRIDGEKLLGPGFGLHEPLFLDEVLMKFRNRKIILVEPKDGRCGEEIVRKLREYAVSKDFVIVNSFHEESLRAAIRAGFKSCLNLNDMNRSPESLKRAGLWGVTCPYPVTEEYVQSLKKVGLTVLGYVTNRRWERDQLIHKGVDGVPTDDPLYLHSVGHSVISTDKFASQRWMPGMLPGSSLVSRGLFEPPDKWGIDGAAENVYFGCLQGWLTPEYVAHRSKAWAIELTITFEKLLTPDRWASIAVMTTDHAMNSDTPSAKLYGYNILFRGSGEVEVIKYSGEVGKSSPSIGKVSGPKVPPRGSARYRVEFSDSSLSVKRLDQPVTLHINDSDHRGRYVTLGVKGVKATFSNIHLEAESQLPAQ